MDHVDVASISTRDGSEARTPETVNNGVNSSDRELRIMCRKKAIEMWEQRKSATVLA